MSVAIFQFNRLTWYILSALYLLAMGRIADLVPFCNVAFNVALALFGPMHQCSANVSAVNLECLSEEIKVLRAGTSWLFSQIFLLKQLEFLQLAKAGFHFVKKGLFLTLTDCHIKLGHLECADFFCQTLVQSESTAQVSQTRM